MSGRKTLLALITAPLIINAAGCDNASRIVDLSPGTLAIAQSKGTRHGQRAVTPDTSGAVPAPGPSTSLFLRPFSATSPWNSPVSVYQGATYASTAAFKDFVPAMSTWPGALGASMWQATNIDPVVTLYFHPDAWINVAQGKWKRSGNTAAVEQEIRAGMDQKWAGYQGNPYSTTDPAGYAMPSGFRTRESYPWSLQAHVPVGAVPPPDADGHMAVFQPNGSVLELIAPIRLSNGDIVSVFASYTDPAGDGTGMSDGRRASMLPNYAGLLRDGELTSGHISHALAIALGPEALSKSVVWPAAAMDRNPTDYIGTIPMGALLAIAPGTDLRTLSLRTAAGRTIATAAQEYGMYVVDRTGPRYFLIATETRVSDVPGWNTELETDLKMIRDNLQIVRISRP